MNANFAALLYLVAGILFILALRGLSSPASSRQGNRFGMIGMAIAVVTTLALRAARPIVAARHPRFRHRRRFRRLTRAHRSDDRDAATGGDVPFARRPCGGVRGRGRALCAAGLRHRQGGDIHRASRRNVAGSRHRRDDLHRLDHRLSQTRRADVGQADHAAAAPCDQHRAGRRARRPRRAFVSTQIGLASG